MTSPTQSSAPVPDARQLRALIARELPAVIALRRDLHAHPELRYQEVRTSRTVAAELAALGMKVSTGLGGGTGLLGHLPGQSAAGIALRADMDALPIVEETGAPYASKNPGLMHACGHDGHTAILVGAARVLSTIAASTPLPRPVTFVFQPAEEGGGGARRMIEDGCLTGQHTGSPVEAIFGLHGWPELPLNTVSTRPGPILASSDTFEITIFGKGGHAAFPHLALDPIPVAAAVHAAVSAIPRSVSAMDPVILTVTQFHAGSANNIIPPHAILSGTVRAFNPQVRAYVQSRLENLAPSVAQAMGCQCKVTYNVGYPVTSNDADAFDTFQRVARQTLSEDQLIPMPSPVTGSEDFSFYGQRVPACFFFLGLLPADSPAMPALHNPGFDFNDDAIATGIEMFCRLALHAPSQAK